MSYRNTQRIGKILCGATLAMLLCLAQTTNAQRETALSRIEPGTTVQVRTTQPIESSVMDGRVYTATVENDVRDSQDRVVIPRGASAELIVRRDQDNDFVLDLDSITISNRRYGVDATRNRLPGSGVDIRQSGIGANRETARNVGGGALLGAVIGAMIGGGDAAAAGAVAGAAVGAGAQILTKGRTVRVPAETVLTYQLQSGLDVDVKDTGYMRDGFHYHKYGEN